MRLNTNRRRPKGYRRQRWMGKLKAGRKKYTHGTELKASENRERLREMWRHVEDVEWTIKLRKKKLFVRKEFFLFYHILLLNISVGYSYFLHLIITLIMLLNKIEFNHNSNNNYYLVTKKKIIWNNTYLS